MVRDEMAPKNLQWGRDWSGHVSPGPKSTDPKRNVFFETTKCFHFFLDFFGFLWTVQQVLRARGNLGSAICCRKFRHCSWPEALVIHIFLFTTLKLFLLLFAFFFLQLLSTVFTISCSLRLTNPGRLVIRFSVKTSVWSLVMGLWHTNTQKNEKYSNTKYTNIYTNTKITVDW